MLALKPEARLALQEAIMIQAIPELDRYYAFNIETGDHFRLNHTAYSVLEAIAAGITASGLSSRFAETFELSPENAYKDLSEVIGFAIENDIIKEV